MTDEQFNALAPYEENYKTAIEVNYSRYPGVAAIDTMFNVYRAVTNSRININRTCGTCILHLVQDVGKLYFAEKKRREQLKAEPEPKPDKAKKTVKKTKKAE
jgi:hypothetical protein